jgi:hypothetical protein
MRFINPSYNHEKFPRFIFSLPRSGSTLLQRVLMSHRDIASVSEPWFLLPFSYAYKKEGILTEYSHGTSYAAFEDFINNLPNKEDDYYQALGGFANKLYQKQCFNDEKYFLDKTPRYYNIIPEIAKSFPEAKFIFLFRNPVHVMSSMMKTWGEGRFKKMYVFDRDLNHGLKALSDNYEKIRDRACAIQYEKYVENPEKYTKEICNYLEIEFNMGMLNNFSKQFTKGRMGDPTGVKDYRSVDIRPLQKWKKTFSTTFRKKYIKDYIRSIDTLIFKTQGYSKLDILKEIEELDVKNINYFQDRVDLVYSYLVRIIKPNIWLGKITKKWARNKYLA